ncbi:flagellar hook protein FlgE [Roseateles amylovorans]|jgi:flagellar hook protein FlgE|uniref:Flagellar hook protein FlgE n=1 Tax=Roseateles amylovorans TaxID=2978473 RepID=A0ABY6AVB9_9BURK|nr:flagellar hook-basal body complex protein [Roseateles amylovorans]UXH76883.1 flagellar hook-basal body complex protein [Roseateles amylovorans]
MSFEIARSGINAVNASLDTISNNIANSGTYGYKASRTNFSAMVADNNAIGVEASSTSQSIQIGGGLFSTGRGMDAMVQGRGFFAVRNDAGQTVFSRVGIFNVDKDGFVVDTLGRKAQGYAAVLDANGRPVPGAGLGAFGDLKVATGQISAQPSSTLAFNGNLSADWTVPAIAPFDKDDSRSYSSSATSVIYDSLGTKHSVTQYFVKTGVGTVDAYYSFDGAAPAGVGATLNFNAQGQLTAVPTVTLNAAPANGAAPLVLDINYTGTTQFAGDTTTLTNETNGYAAGTLTGTSISEDGSVVAAYSNGEKQVVGTLALATFANEGGLKPISDTSWESSVESGVALYSRPGAGAAAKLSGGALEQSNVDITGELVSLMSAQRNYQANTKVLSTENDVMQALMQAI